MGKTPKPVEPLLRCSKCNEEMRLFGVEPESAKSELYTFECPKCGALEVRRVGVK